MFASQGRVYSHQSCAVVSSAYWTLAYWWASLLFFLGRLLFPAFLRAVLRLPALRLLLGCFPVWVRVALGSCCLLVGLVGPVSSPPGEGVELLLCVFAFLVCAFFVLVLYVYWGVFRSWLSFTGSPWTSSFFSQLLYLGRFAAFSDLRSTRQVERFAECSFDICRM